MKGLIIGTLALVMLVSSVAFATQVRVLTLGENNVILRDDANIYLFPSTINNYKKLVVGEFGRTYEYSEYPFIESTDFRDLGIHWQMGGEENPFVLGTYLHNSEAISPREYVNFNFTDFPSSNKRIDLFGGASLGDLPVGFHIGLVHSSVSEDNSSKDEASFASYSFDAGITLADGKADIAGGMAIASFTDIGTTPDGNAYDETKSEGNLRLHFLARYFLEKNPRYTIVPHIGGSLAAYEYSNYRLDGNDPEKYRTTTWGAVNFEAGAGFVWTPIEKALCLFDAGIAIYGDNIETDPVEGDKTEDKRTVLTVPYFKVGFEGHVFKWMDVRFGATSHWQNYKRTSDYGDYEFVRSYPSNETYLGFGFHWNRLHVDTYTDPELFLDGFNFISGRENDMNFMISVFYDLD